MRKAMLALAMIMIVFAIFAGLLVFREYETLLAVADFAGLEVPPALDVRAYAERRTVSYQRRDQRYTADLYLPGERARAGIVLVHGAVERGKDDPRLRDFSVALSRVGFIVLVPTIEDLRQGKLLPGSAQDVVDAFDYLISDETPVTTDRVGMGAFSIGTGLALLAALDQTISERVRFVFAVGGYYDLPRTLTYFTTGHHEAYGVRSHRPPDEAAKWIFALSNASQLEDDHDRKVLLTLARHKLSDPEADVSEDVASLGPAGQALNAFIINTDPAQARVLLARLPQGLRDKIKTLDLASHELSRIKARLILVHGMDDNIIPYTESKALADAIPSQRVRLFLLRGLHHVDTRPSAVDAFQMFAAARALLSERDVRNDR